jgi:Xaa-Pro aminopeptidase
LVSCLIRVPYFGRLKMDVDYRHGTGHGVGHFLGVHEGAYV